ncbi:DUF6615 family protein [Bradyrhizobium sp. USDA 3364]
MPKLCLCETFRKEAGIVWNRMRRAARLGISLSEETITECALFDIAAAHQQKDIVIDLATKPAENKHGADWEWWLVHKNQGICFRIQAKRLYQDGTYRALKKAGQHPYQQLDKLVNHAQQAGAFPLYCFYSFQHSHVSFGGPDPCNQGYRAPSFWGCAFAFPDEIKKSGSDQLKALKPLMQPWHALVCHAATSDLPTAAAKFVNERKAGAAPKLGALPERVARLMHIGDQNRKTDVRDQPPPSFLEESETPEEVAGLVVFRDLRD